MRTDPKQDKINSPTGDAEEKHHRPLMAGLGETWLAGFGSFLGGEAGLSPEGQGSCKQLMPLKT